MMLHRSLSFGMGALIALSLFGCKTPEPKENPPPQDDAPRPPVDVRIIALNDLHGNIEQPSSPLKLGEQKLAAGGLDVMATYLAALRREHPHTAFVCAGDLIGASPLISALFHDEPTIEAMNALGLDVLAVGNHEFDDGTDELLRLKNGGCHPELGCQGKESFAGASFPFLAANVVVNDTNETLFPATVIKSYDGVKVGFIGLTLEGTAAIVSPDSIKKVHFLDEVETINAQVKLLQEQGVEAIVVVIHEGGWQGQEGEDPSSCEDLQGPIVAINQGLDPAVDVMITGHTHRYYTCTLEGRLVTSAKDYGRMLTAIDLKIDPRTGDVVSKEARNVPLVREGQELQPEMVAFLDTYRQRVAPLASRQIGVIEKDLMRSADDQGNSIVGQLIADAQLAATSAPDAGEAQFAFMNLGGVRNDLVMAPMSSEPPGVLTYEELHSVQPFGNTLTVIELTGAQIEQLLESQWRDDERNNLLQPSANLTYTWHDTPGDHILIKEILLDGKPLKPEQLYRFTVNSYLASGGDGLEILKESKQIAGGPVDLDAFVAYVEHHSPLRPPKKARILHKK